MDEKVNDDIVCEVIASCDRHVKKYGFKKMSLKKLDKLCCLAGNCSKTSMPQKDDEGEYSKEFRIGLLNARLDLKKDRTISLSEAKKTLGLQ